MTIKMYIYCAVFVIFIICYLIIHFSLKKIKVLKNELLILEDSNKKLQLQIEDLKLEKQIKERNQKYAEEKLNSLHSGNALDNAISRLSKQKSK